MAKGPRISCPKTSSLGLKPKLDCVTSLVAKAIPPPSHDSVQYNKRTTKFSMSSESAPAHLDFADDKRLIVGAALAVAIIFRQTFLRKNLFPDHFE